MSVPEELSLPRADLNLLVANHIQSVAFQQAGLDSYEDASSVLLFGEGNRGLSVKREEHPHSCRRKQRMLSVLLFLASLCCMCGGLAAVLLLMHLKLIPMSQVKGYLYETKCKIQDIAVFPLQVQLAHDAFTSQAKLSVGRYSQSNLKVSCIAIGVTFCSIESGHWLPGLIIETFGSNPYVTSQCYTRYASGNLTMATSTVTGRETPGVAPHPPGVGYSLLRGHVYPCYATRPSVSNTSQFVKAQVLLQQNHRGFSEKLRLVVFPTVIFVVGFVGTFFGVIHLQHR